jgi:hypothetical protein
MKRKIVRISFLAVIALLVVSLALTIIGSMFDKDAVMNVGIVAWLVTIALIFVWLILLVWGRLTRYDKGKG